MKTSNELSQTDHTSVPANFLCPLTRKLMQEPVMDHDGHNFEKNAIIKWIGQEEEGHAVCPISRKPLEVDDLIPNTSLQQTIQRWLERNTGPEIPQEDHSHTTPTTKSTTTTREPTYNRSDNNDIEMGKGLAHIISKGGYLTVHAHPQQIDTTDDRSTEKADAATISSFDSSLLYSMFLPQEREAMEWMEQHERQRQEAERLAHFKTVGKEVSIALISVVFIVLLLDYIRLNLLH